MEPNYNTDRIEPDCYEEPDYPESNPDVNLETFSDDEW